MNNVYISSWLIWLFEGRLQKNCTEALGPYYVCIFCIFNVFLCGKKICFKSSSELSWALGKKTNKPHNNTLKTFICMGWIQVDSCRETALIQPLILHHLYYIYMWTTFMCNVARWWRNLWIMMSVVWSVYPIFFLKDLAGDFLYFPFYISTHLM